MSIKQMATAPWLLVAITLALALYAATEVERMDSNLKILNQRFEALNDNFSKLNKTLGGQEGYLKSALEDAKKLSEELRRLREVGPDELDRFLDRTKRVLTTLALRIEHLSTDQRIKDIETSVATLSAIHEIVAELGTLDKEKKLQGRIKNIEATTAKIKTVLEKLYTLDSEGDSGIIVDIQTLIKGADENDGRALLVRMRMLDDVLKKLLADNPPQDEEKFSIPGIKKQVTAINSSLDALYVVPTPGQPVPAGKPINEFAAKIDKLNTAVGNIYDPTSVDSSKPLNVIQSEVNKINQTLTNLTSENLKLLDRTFLDLLSKIRAYRQNQHTENPPVDTGNGTGNATNGTTTTE